MASDGPMGIDIEIWDDNYYSTAESPLGVILPRRLKINGVEVLTPEGKPIIENISPLDGKNALSATLNVFVRSLTIRGGPNG